MTQELTGIRRALTRVSSELKQNRLLPAAKAVQAAARALIRLPLLKNEQDMQLLERLAAVTRSTTRRP